jgi:hypothetical protein
MTALWTQRPEHWGKPGYLNRSSENEDILDQIDELTTALVNLEDPGWTSYVATWTAASVNPAIGNGTISGRYRRSTDSDLIIYEGKILMGSTTTFGTGQWFVSLPVAPSSDAVIFTTCAVFILDTGTTTRTGVARFNSSTQLTFETTGGFTSASPQVWANGDYFTWSIEYEAA